MSVRTDRVSPSGPPNSNRLQVSLDHGNISAQNTLSATASLPAKTARVGDAVTVNPTSSLQSGLVIAACRISDPDTLEITLGNLTTADIDPSSITYDVQVRKV